MKNGVNAIGGIGRITSMKEKSVTSTLRRANITKPITTPRVDPTKKPTTTKNRVEPA
jgi:hypothetical protein